MNKNELISKVKDNIDIEVPKKDLNTIVDEIFDVIKNTISAGEKVNISCFGSFEVVDRAERVGRNPKTGESVKIKASKSPKFKASKALKDAVNL